MKLQTKSDDKPLVHWDTAWCVLRQYVWLRDSNGNYNRKNIYGRIDGHAMECMEILMERLTEIDWDIDGNIGGTENHIKLIRKCYCEGIDDWH